MIDGDPSVLESQRYENLAEPCGIRQKRCGSKELAKGECDGERVGHSREDYCPILKLEIEEKAIPGPGR